VPEKTLPPAAFRSPRTTCCDVFENGFGVLFVGAEGGPAGDGRVDVYEESAAFCGDSLIDHIIIRGFVL
jgi:hypothetical protein